MDNKISDNGIQTLNKELFRDSKIRILLKAFSHPATSRELTNILFMNNMNQSNVNAELNEMIRM